MAGTRAAIRYAKAVLSLANDQKNAQAINDDMLLIAKTIADNEELSLMLKSSVIKSDRKKAVLLEVFKTINEASGSLFDVLIANKRINILGEIAEKYTVLFDESTGKQKATVITAVSMTSDLETSILAKVKELTNKTKAIELENIVDESILGGFILRVGDIQYNASIANKLNRLRREFSLN